VDSLPLRQLRLGDFHDFFVIRLVERTRRRPPVQLFQAVSHLIPARFMSIAVFTVWAVDSQEGQ